MATVHISGVVDDNITPPTANRNEEGTHFWISLYNKDGDCLYLNFETEEQMRSLGTLLGNSDIRVR